MIRQSGLRRYEVKMLKVEKKKRGHVIVVGNEKGGSGKSTTAMHVAVGLLSQ